MSEAQKIANTVSRLEPGGLTLDTFEIPVTGERKMIVGLWCEVDGHMRMQFSLDEAEKFYAKVSEVIHWMREMRKQ